MKFYYLLLCLQTWYAHGLCRHCGECFSELLSSRNAEVKSVECHLHALTSVVTVVFIHTMDDDQRLNTLVHEGDTLHFSLQHWEKTINLRLSSVLSSS